VPYTREYYKTIVAGSVAAALMWGMISVLSGFTLLVIGSLCGGVVFLAVLYALGLGREEQIIIEKAVGLFRSRINTYYAES
jgi:hypothetical protein